MFGINIEEIVAPLQAELKKFHEELNELKTLLTEVRDELKNLTHPGKS
jgi:hypothetical protein